MHRSTVPKALPASLAFHSLATCAVTPHPTPCRSSVVHRGALCSGVLSSVTHSGRAPSTALVMPQSLPPNPTTLTWLCLRTGPQEDPRWEVSFCYRDRMEKLPAVPSGTLTLSKSRVPQVPSNKLRAIPRDCQGPVGPTPSLDQSSWHKPLGACCPEIRSASCSPG